MAPSTIRNIVTLGALLLALVHILWPNLAVDGVTLALVAIALVPWLAPLFKSVELPGGWKVEFQELQQMAARADTAGLLNVTGEEATPEGYSFQAVASTDPNLALAGLRIEIEKRLNALAAKYQVPDGTKGIGRLTRSLEAHNALTLEERSVLADMIGLLNSAVHGAAVDPRASDWAIQFGSQLLKSLDQRINTQEQ